jgi:hypothetical protein
MQAVEFMRQAAPFLGSPPVLQETPRGTPVDEEWAFPVIEWFEALFQP